MAVSLMSVALMRGKGILVVELKGWREENILRIENSDTIII